MDLTQLKTESPLVSGFAESRIGGRGENQDSFDWADTPKGVLVTVCDGMGGGPGGKTASSIAVQEIITGVMEADPQEQTSNVLIKAIRRANMAIINQANETPALQGMGSTCTVALINQHSATIAHVGDSRVYQLRGRGKIFRTFDHSMVFELVKQKVITEEQARLSAQSNVITRALGIKPDLEVDIAECAYEKGDRFLLCTDGIHGAVDEKTLLSYATNRKIALGTVVDNIATEIDNIGRNNGGGHDNLTLAILETKVDSKMKDSMSRKIKQILCAIGLVCLISLVCNVVLLVKNNKLSDGKAVEYLKLNESLNDSLEKTVTNLERYQNVVDKIRKDTAASQCCEQIFKDAEI